MPSLPRHGRVPITSNHCFSITSVPAGARARVSVTPTVGDTHLSGDDVDRLLMGVAREALAGRVDEAVLQDPKFPQAGRLAAEKCKIALSSDPVAELVISLPERGVNLRRPVTRKESEALIEPLVERTFVCGRREFDDAGLAAADVVEVFLVGGSTRIPYVRRRVEAMFDRKPHTELNPDEVVALGAAA